MLPATELRNGTLPDLVDLLKRQADVKYDVVVPASRLRYEDGNLHVIGGAMRFDDEGFSECDAILAPTDVFEDGVSEKLGIPRAYVRKLRTDGPDVVINVPGYSPGYPANLLDANVNAWLQAEPDRKFLVRAFRTDDADEVGIARALLSNSYARYDSYDGILAVLDGVRDAGVQVEIHAANLTERNCRLSIYSPEIAVEAPLLLANYRTPFTPGQDRGFGTVPDAGGKKLPIVFAGFEFRNSETGGGAFTMLGRVVETCGNGMTKTATAQRRPHLGRKLEEGVVLWSEETQRLNLNLVRSMTADAVKSFLSRSFVENFVAEVEEQAVVPLTDAAATIEHVAKVHAFTEDEAKSILDCFIKSGDVTAGGVMQAVTAAAQLVSSPDRAAEMEDSALGVLATAAS